MYQSILKDITEEDLLQLTSNLEENITHFKLDEINNEFDMKAIYITNHACIWNKAINIKKKCKILQKNNKIAIVIFEDEELFNTDDILHHMYRLEDLNKDI